MVLLLVMLQTAICTAQSPTKRVRVAPHDYNILILHSYHEAFQWTADINRGIEKEISIHPNLHSYSEYMDTKRIESRHYFETLKELYMMKYPKGFFNAIICSDNSALEFIINYGDQIWGRIPVTFCGVNNAETYRTRVDTTLITGVAENIDIKSNIEFAFKINPALNEVIFVTDSTLTGSLLIDEASKSTSYINTRYLFIDDATDFDNKIAQIDFTNKAVYVLSLFSKKKHISNELSKEYIYHLNNTNALILGPWDFLLNNLAVGGRLIRGEVQGRQAADMMINRLLDVESKTSFIEPTIYTWMGDEQICEKQHIPKTLFPQGTTWVNVKIGWFKKNEALLLFGFGGLTFSFFITSMFLYILRKKRKAESERQESETRLDIALDAANVGLWDVDFKSRLFFVSDRFAQLLGYDSAKEYNNQLGSWNNDILPEDIQGMKEEMTKITTATPSFTKELQIKTKDKKPVWFMVFGKVTEWDSNANIGHITGIIINISKRKEFERQLREAKEKAEMSDRLKSSFLANMSHEIRTPMNAIIGFTEILAGFDNMNEEQNQYLQIIKSSGDSLLSLINDIIDLSKIESGYMTINVESFKFEPVVDSMKAIIQSQIINSGKDIELRISSNINLSEITLKSDQHRIKQILLNLLTNAVKFTEKGYIELNINKYDQRIDFSVIDTGIGIPEESFNDIFQRFRQLDETAARKSGGTGLGLSITKSIVTMLGGSINVISKLGKGTTFMIVLPLPSPTNKDDETEENNNND